MQTSSMCVHDDRCVGCIAHSDNAWLLYLETAPVERADILGVTSCFTVSIPLIYRPQSSFPVFTVTQQIVIC